MVERTSDGRLESKGAARMKINEIYSSSYQPISFEIFPPKGDLTVEAARGVLEGLAPLRPDFISVTYSAGGSGNNHATAEVSEMVQGEFEIPVVAHLTCINTTSEELDAKIADMKAHGIENVLALRGDRIPGREATDFKFAKDLIPRLVEEGFCVGAAAYPEGHIDCTSMRDNIEHLKEKQDAGASFFVTQLFFDNEYFYRFRDLCDNAGITVPISCGIMPFMSKSQISRMVFMCGASLPSPVIKLLAKYEHSDAALRQAGIEYASQQLVDLAQHGADGLHVYTMNKPEVAQNCVTAIRAARGE